MKSVQVINYIKLLTHETTKIIGVSCSIDAVSIIQMHESDMFDELFGSMALRRVDVAKP